MRPIMTRPVFRLSACAVALSVLLGVPGIVFAQGPLARAKGLYESADYEQALQVLETLKGQDANTEAAAYQVFCLVALGRTDEARLAIETIVKADPLYRPSDAQVSPRVRTFFEDVRRPLLPEVVRLSYAQAKASFDSKDWSPAVKEFGRVIAMIDEISDTDQGAADLRTLAVGFRDLARAALEPPPPPPPPAPPAAAPTAPPLLVPAEPKTYGPEDQDVKSPVVVTKTLPEWRPANAAEQMRTFSGVVELIVNEQGRVVSATLLRSVHPRYDGPLLEAARTWTFRPATLNGVPVRYRYAVAMQLGR